MSTPREKVREIPEEVLLIHDIVGHSECCGVATPLRFARLGADILLSIEVRSGAIRWFRCDRDGFLMALKSIKGWLDHMERMRGKV